MPRSVLLAVLVVSMGAWPHQGAAAAAAPCSAPPGWPEADRPFPSDRRWLGADGAFSVDLDGDRMLRRSGNSWIDISGSGRRDNTAKLRKTITIHEGYDPTTASITYHWQAGTAARAFFAKGDDVGIRHADALTDTWTSPQRVYSPPEKAKPNATIYAAKAHPEFEGADLVLTYATNSFRFMDHLEDADSYYPHFVRLMHCANQQ